jgi:glycosyltransferase involved in cell wall biosynthesis
VTPGLTSIIIPTFNHGRYLPEAIDSALRQTASTEVIVVDDGSTDETPGVLASYGDRVRAFRIDHAGPSVARNRGIDEAQGEFLMFLDADDVCAPTKVEQQLGAMAAGAGWVLCDVRIHDERSPGHAVLASQKYGYRKTPPSGWLASRLAVRNFIPILSPVVRRSVVGDIRFPSDRHPEDWPFWQEVASKGRAVYVADVLATYRKRERGRHRLPKVATDTPGFLPPLRLNLGCGTQGKPSWHPLPGFVNLDKSLGWRFEDGLPTIADHSVEGITVSHSLYLVPLERWFAVFSEFARVLADGGVIRITEDDAFNPASSCFGGWRGSESCVTKTSAEMVLAMLERVGLSAREVDAETTYYADPSLLQRWHGEPPDVFFVEGRRRSSVLFSPHNDDECLFAAFTVQKYRPRVVVCYPSVRDYGDPLVRAAESRASLEILGAPAIEQWNGGDLVAAMIALDNREGPELVWAPDERASHPEHVAVARAAREVFGARVATFHTYDAGGKVRGREAAAEPEWLMRKLRALACYRTQIEHPRARAFFLDGLAEYLGGEA